MKSKQIISFMLLAALLTSCGEAVSDKSNDTETAENTFFDTQGQNDRTAVSDNLPTKNYNGEDFVIATETGAAWTVFQEESTGDVVDDAVYKRNLAVEDRFGVKIQYISDTFSELSKKIVSMVTSGDDEIDLCMTHVVQSGKNALDGIYLNWYDIPYVDFSKPWWSNSTIEDLSYNNVCFLAIGDVVLSALERTYCMFFNKSLTEEYKIDGIYDTVLEGNWTLDYMQKTTKDIYEDLNANGERDDDDLFGMVTNCQSAVNTYLWSFGGKVLDSSSGEIQLVYHSAKTGDMVEKLCKLFSENDGIYVSPNDKEQYNYAFNNTAFTSSRAVFINSSIGSAVSQYRDMKDDYGIIPYPKYDEAQEKYYTMVDGSHPVLCIPTTVRDTEKTGIITEALNAESYKSLVPAYYETALKVKYSRDDESVQILDMIVNSRVFDLGYVYDGWMGASFIFQKLIAANNPNFESYWASNESAITAHYDEVIEYFENYDK